MWASKTDYGSAVSDGADGADGRGGRKRPSRGRREQALAAVCRELSVERLVDVGLPANAAELSRLGIKVDSLKGAAKGAARSRLDLRTASAGEIGAAGKTLRKKTDEQPYLLACLDFLHRTDLEDIAATLLNLHALAHEQVLVSISTRPGPDRDACSPAVLPLATWKALFAVAGFEPRIEDVLAEVGPAPGFDAEEHPLLAHWVENQPFGESQDGGLHHLLLRRAGNVDREDATLTISRMLDLEFRQAKRAQFGGPPQHRVALNIHHLQDFLIFRPILDVLPRAGTVALLRNDTLPPPARALVRGLFRRCGVALVEYESSEEIDWRRQQIDVLLSATESNAQPEHVLSRSLVEAAKLQGVKAIVLQHGIWVETDAFDIVYGSPTVLSWGPEHLKSLEAREGARRSAHPQTAPSPINDIAVGSPKFTDSVLAPEPDVLRWRLGVDRSRYRRTILIGTNLKWPAHGTSTDDVLDVFDVMLDRNPDTFFIFKIHPAETPSDYARLRRSNTAILDDVLMGCMDLQLSRLLNGVDAVYSSLSTLMLDAVVASRPTVQFDTGNRHAYLYCTPISPDELQQPLSDAPPTIAAAAFREHYAAAEDGAFYVKLAHVLTDIRALPLGDVSLDSYALCRSLEEVRHRAKAEIARRDEEVLSRRSQVASLGTGLDLARARNEEMVREVALRREQVEQLSGGLELSQREVVLAKEEVLLRRKQVEELSAALEQFRTQSEKLANEVSLRSGQVADLTDGLDQFRRQSTAMENELSLRRKQVEDLTAGLGQFRTQSVAMESELTLRRRQVEDLTGGLEQFRTQNAAMESELTLRRRQVEDLTGGLEQFRMQNAAMESELTLRRRQVEDLTEGLEQSRTQNAAMESELVLRRRQINDLGDALRIAGDAPRSRGEGITEAPSGSRENLRVLADEA